MEIDSTLYVSQNNIQVPNIQVQSLKIEINNSLKHNPLLCLDMRAVSWGQQQNQILQVFFLHKLAVMLLIKKWDMALGFDLGLGLAFQFKVKTGSIWV